MRTLLFLSCFLIAGCQCPELRITKPDGTMIEARSFSLFMDSGLEGFTYHRDESAGFNKPRGFIDIKVDKYNSSARTELLMKLLELP